MIFSNQASRSMEDCAAVMGDAPRWFQLYWSTSNELVASFVSRAEACGCDAIVVTLDTTMLGWRCRDLDLAYLPFAVGQGDRAVHERPGVSQPADAGQARGRQADAEGRPLDARGERRLPGRGLQEHALRDGDRGRPDVPVDLLTPVADLGRPPVPARADEAADPAQGDPASGGCPARGRARSGRDRRLHARRPPGRRRARLARFPPAGGRGGRRPHPGPARQRHSRRRRRLQGARTGRARGADRPAVRLRARARRARTACGACSRTSPPTST